MRVWFIRCNGETAHNEPNTALFVPGEPPRFPDRKFNYRNACLEKGFARVGWPATGDLRDVKWRDRAMSAYGAMMRKHHVRLLEQFFLIDVGDLVVLPSYKKQYEVHIGVVISPWRPQSGRTGAAYYYYVDIEAGDWYDTAHRVDVRWARRDKGRPSLFDIPEIGGIWRRAFGEVKAGCERTVQLARDSGLIR